MAAYTSDAEAELAAIPVDFRLSSYNFNLPEELIAQYPSAERGGSRLYVLKHLNDQTGQDNQNDQADYITSFQNILEALPPNCLFVANNSRVLPARLPGQLPSGGKFEFLLLSPLPLLETAAQKIADDWNEAEAEALLRPVKKIKVGVEYKLGTAIYSSNIDSTGTDNNPASGSLDTNTPKTGNLNTGSSNTCNLPAGSYDLCFTVLEKGAFGQCRVKLCWRGSLQQTILSLGKLPLPPYIRRESTALDNERYQTVFSKADKCGSVAAPTAGLHFTPALREALLGDGHDWAEITLFVGYGTFSPVREADIRKHNLHAEYVEITADTVDKILAAKAAGRPIIAVGTTSTRVLEGLAEQTAGQQTTLLTPWRGWLNCFIHPGKKLRVIDGLLTNFHLPESSLLMLVSAMCGRERLLTAYKKAIGEKMRFFSYGDAMLIL